MDLTYDVYYSIYNRSIDAVFDAEGLEESNEIINRPQHYYIFDFSKEFIVYKNNCDIKGYFDIPNDMIKFFKFLIEYIILIGIHQFDETEMLATEAKIFGHNELSEKFEDDEHLYNIVYEQIDIIDKIKLHIEESLKKNNILNKALLPYSWERTNIGSIDMRYNYVNNHKDIAIPKFILVCVL
jgi:hypothetical protein